MAAVQVAPEQTDTRLVRWPDGRVLSVVEDDWVVDLETGEFVGHLVELEEPKDVVINHDYCNDIVRRRANTVARMAGYEAQMKMLIQGIEQRFVPKIKAEKRKLEWLDLGHMKNVFEFVLGVLKGKNKGKSYDFDFGRVSFAKAGGKVEIVDPEKATQYALAHSPGAVKVAIDLNQITENDVRDKAVELVTLLQSLAPDAVALDTRKSMVKLREGERVPNIKPEWLECEWDVRPDNGLFQVWVKAKPDVMVHEGFDTQKDALEFIGISTDPTYGIVFTPVNDYEPKAVSH